MLVSHEFGHIAHLTRPSRSRGVLDNLRRALPIDVGPIAIRAPRWVIEGYATFIEGRVTGSGRPHGVWRPALLRELALEGQLPRYENLNASGAFEGGSFAYLAGSAFLEWLAEQRGDSSLVFVWRRLTARQIAPSTKRFAAFSVNRPSMLYGRFTADVTGKALATRATIEVGADTGDIIQRLAWYTGDPAISPDGKRVAILLRSAVAPSRIVVWSTAAEPDTGTRASRFDSARARPRRRSGASDLSASQTRPREPSGERRRSVRVAALSARRTRPRVESRAARRWIVRPGSLHLGRSARLGSSGDSWCEPLEWRSSSQRARRDRDALPLGWCELVAVDLETGAVRVIAEGGPEESYFRPRVSRDGSRAVGVRAHAGRLASPHRRCRDRRHHARGRTRERGRVRRGVARLDVHRHDDGRHRRAANRAGEPRDATSDGRSPTSPARRSRASRIHPTAACGSSSLYFRGYDLRRLTWSASVPVAPRIAASLTPPPLSLRSPCARSRRTFRQRLARSDSRRGSSSGSPSRALMRTVSAAGWR